HAAVTRRRLGARPRPVERPGQPIHDTVEILAGDVPGRDHPEEEPRALFRRQEEDGDGRPPVAGRVVLGPIGVVGRHHVNSEPGRPARNRVEKRDGALLAFLASFASLVSVTAEEAPHPLTVLRTDEPGPGSHHPLHRATGEVRHPQDGMPGETVLYGMPPPKSRDEAGSGAKDPPAPSVRLDQTNHPYSALAQEVLPPHRRAALCELRKPLEFRIVVACGLRRPDGDRAGGLCLLRAAQAPLLLLAPIWLSLLLLRRPFHHTPAVEELVEPKSKVPVAALLRQRSLESVEGQQGFFPGLLPGLLPTCAPATLLPDFPTGVHVTPPPAAGGAPGRTSCATRARQAPRPVRAGRLAGGLPSSL